MSYARWSGSSNVYVYADVAGGVTCCCCALIDDEHSFNCPTAAEMAEHLREHISAGHLVPGHAIESVLADAKFIEGDK